MKNKKFNITHITIILTLFALLSPGLFPESGLITFQVPVELKNIHNDLKNWRVHVRVINWVQGGGVVNGYSQVPFNVNKNYSGLITVPVNVPDMSKADSYEVRLEIKNPKNNQWTLAKNLFNQNPEYNTDPSKPMKGATEGKIEFRK